MTPEQRARVKELFAAAVQLPREQQQSYVRQSAPTEPSIVTEVLSLLEHHTAQTLLLDEAPADGNLERRSPSDGCDQSASVAGTRWKHLDRTLTLEHGTPPRVPSHRRGGPRWVGLGPAGILALGVVGTCLILSVVGYAVTRSTSYAVRELRESKIRSVLRSTVKAIELWMEQEELRVETVARDPDLQRAVQQLVTSTAVPTETKTLVSADEQRLIRQQVQGLLGPDARYAIWNSNYVKIADWTAEAIGVGQGVTPHGAAILADVLDGNTRLRMPGQPSPITKDYPLEGGRSRIGVITPIRNVEDRVQAALLVYGVGAEQRFNEILEFMRIGHSGDAFAFDHHGQLLSESRFGAELAQLQYAHLPDTDLAGRALFVRDPGGDLARGYKNDAPSATWPLTKMARYATAGESGMDLDGYRNFLGVSVIGAWQWLPQYGFGVATEIEVGELKRPLRAMQLLSYVTLAILAAALLTALGSYHNLHRLRGQLGSSNRLGQYVLEEKIGEGGMGIVYRARHSLLKRPTAVKQLKPEIANRRTITWFEREVQLASQLTHPNTIAIYDFGITPEGVFYYAMELLHGQTLEEVVQQTGPRPPLEVIRILRQVAGSLREAHRVGLVHRDIKPQNIMLCQCGGETGVVKVLDFGLVKPIQSGDSPASTVLAGTPIYMAPERLVQPQLNDPRSDVYAVGAVAFYLLTGREVFADNSESAGLLGRILHEVPPAIHQLVASPIPVPLEQLITRCLAKQMAERPQGMDEVLTVLHALHDTAYPGETTT